MRANLLWAPIALLQPYLLGVFAQATGTTAGTTTTNTIAASSCTASQIANVCNYKEPGPEFAIASSSRSFCWEYCNNNVPCNFVIFVAGNPFTGTGTCWLYPGESYDASAASSDCNNPTLFVDSKPECAASATTTPGVACAATASPSAVAEVCGYPTPPDDCFDTCYASSSASQCLNLCVNADACSYAIFNPHNSDNSPYADGTCWTYPNGTYDAGLAATCNGPAEQYVYNNVCPKPSHPSSSSAATTSTSSPSSGISSSASASSNNTTSNDHSAATSLCISKSLVIGVAILLWQCL